MRKVLRPMTLLLNGEHPQQIMHCVVKPFTLAIALCMVGCGSGLLNFVQATQLVDNSILKAAALVRMEMGEDPIPNKPLPAKETSHCRL